MKKIIISILTVVSFTAFSQKKLEEAINLIKDSYRPFEVLLIKDNNIKYLEYFMSYQFYDAKKNLKTIGSKVKIYSQNQNSLVDMKGTMVYRFNENIITINKQRKKIIIAQDTPHIRDEKQMIKHFFASRDTIFKFVQGHLYKVIVQDNKQYHQVFLKINPKGQKSQNIKSITWLIDYTNGDFYSMNIEYTKGEKYHSLLFKVLEFEKNTTRNNPINKNILSEIYIKDKSVSKKYSSYKIIDYRN